LNNIDVFFVAKTHKKSFDDYITLKSFVFTNIFFSFSLTIIIFLNFSSEILTVVAVQKSLKRHLEFKEQFPIQFS